MPNRITEPRSVRPFSSLWVNCDALLNKEQNDEWSVAMDDDSSTKAGQIILLFLLHNAHFLWKTLFVTSCITALKV